MGDLSSLRLQWPNRIYRGLDGRWYVRGLFDILLGRGKTQAEALEQAQIYDPLAKSEDSG